MRPLSTTLLINRRSLVKRLAISASIVAAPFVSPSRAFTHSGRTFGIDVSKWGGEIDWRQVVAKLNPRFVFVQAYHQGKDDASSYANPRFANYKRALQRLGMSHGAYLRCHPNANAETSIKKFWAVYAPQAGDILPTLDIEEDYQPEQTPSAEADQSDRKDDSIRLNDNQWSKTDDLHQGAGME
jgi:GH25 family lysozyme M1 (1,4-beta-N-acetylmuramidase)